jgi:polyisoprenoid-binding protein YceI
MTATDTSTAPTIPGYRAGRWVIDPTHSEVGFSVRHLMVSKVRGRFARFEGVIETGPDPLDSSVEASIDVTSIDTNSEDRDAHLRSPDFLDVDQHPALTYRSTRVRADEDGFVLDGDLTLHGVTRPVPLALEVHGFLAESPFGDSRVGFSATTEISRKDFGIEFNAPLEGGGVLLGDKIQIVLEVEAVLQGDA